MISGFASSTRIDYTARNKGEHSSNLPIPFNIPNVLYTLLYEDVGLEFDAKQSDMIETLRFSYKALGRMQERYGLQEQELKEKILKDPDSLELKELYEELQLDVLSGNQHFKDLVIVISDLLKRDQYQKLLKFCNINI